MVQLCGRPRAESRGRALLAQPRGAGRRPTPFREFLEREFPEQASEWDDPEGRRHFLQMMGASLALAGLTGCTRQPEEKIVPYVKPPEEMVPGRPLFFATAVLDGGYAQRRAGREPHGPAHQDRGQPRPPGQPGRDRRVRAGGDPRASTIPTARRRSPTCGEIRPWGDFLAAMQVGRRGAARAGRRRAAHPDRRRHLADARPTQIQRPPQRAARARAGTSGSRRRGRAPHAGAATVPRYHLEQADVVLAPRRRLRRRAARRSVRDCARAFTARRKRGRRRGAGR